jgi:hypothetical protein
LHANGERGDGFKTLDAEFGKWRACLPAHFS